MLDEWRRNTPIKIFENKANTQIMQITRGLSL